MKPRQPIPRKRVKPRNKKKNVARPHAQHRKASRVSEALRDYVRRMPCLASQGVCNGAIEVAHVRSRGAGGTDRANIVPLCRHHHERQHKMGVKSFGTHFRIDLAAEAERITAQFDKENPVPSDDEWQLDPAWVRESDVEAQRDLVRRFLEDRINDPEGRTLDGFLATWPGDPSVYLKRVTP